MADPKIEVIFGAQIAGAIAGIEQVKEAINSLKAPIETINKSFTAISEALGISYAADKLRELAVSMAELGEKTTIMAAALGTTPEAFSSISGAMEIAGGDADTASRTMERLAHNIGAALQNPTSNAALAFGRLGITMADLRTHGDDLNGMILLIADRWTHYRDDLFKTEAAHTILGRSMDRMIPALRQGADGWREMQQRSHDVGATLNTETIRALDQSAEKMNTLGAAAKSLGANLIGQLAPMINAVTTALTAMIAALNRALSLKTPAESAAGRLDELSARRTKLQQEIDSLSSAQGQAARGGYATQGPFAAIGEAAGPFQGERLAGLRQELEETDRQINDTRESMRGLALARGELDQKDKPSVGPAAERVKAGKDTTKSEYEAFAELMRLQIAEADKDWTQISAIYDKWAAHAKAVFGDQSKQYRQVLLEMTRAHQQHIQQIFQQEEHNYAAVSSVNDKYRKAFEENMKAMVHLHQITKQQEFGFDIQYAAQLYQQQRELLESMIQDGQLTNDDRMKVYDQLLELHAKYSEEVNGYNEKLAADTDNIWTRITGKIETSISSIIMGLIKGTESIKQAFVNLGESILQEFLNLGVKAAFNSLFSGAVGAAGGGFSSFLGGLPLIGSLFGGGAGAAVGGAGGSAAADAAAMAVAVLGRGGIIPSAAGGWMIPSFQGGGVLAQLHSNEMVLPSHISQGFQDMFRGGGAGGPTINIHAIDTQSGAQFLMQNSGNIANAWRSGGMYGSLSPRAISSGGRFP